METRLGTGTGDKRAAPISSPPVKAKHQSINTRNIAKHRAATA